MTLIWKEIGHLPKIFFHSLTNEEVIDITVDSNEIKNHTYIKIKYAKINLQIVAKLTYSMGDREKSPAFFQMKAIWLILEAIICRSY